MSVSIKPDVPDPGAALARIESSRESSATATRAEKAANAAVFNDPITLAAATVAKVETPVSERFGLSGWSKPGGIPLAGFNPLDTITDFGKDLIGDVASIGGTLVDAAGRLTNAGGDFVRNKIAEIAGIDDRVAELDSPGDKFTLGLGVEAAAAVKGGAKAELEVSKTADGYVVAVQGQLSAGIFGQLGASAGPADAGAQGAVDLTGKVRIEATFDTLEEAQAAAKNIAGTAIGSALGGPVGAALLQVTGGDELRNFQDNISKTTYEAKLSASASAELGARVGHAGAGGDAKVTASTSAAIVLEPGKDPALVVTSNLTGSASLDLGQDSFELPDGGALDVGANASAKGTVSLSTTIPLGDISVTDALRDPVGTARDLAGQVAAGSTTVKANVLLSGDVNFPGANASFDSKDGVELSVSANVNNSNLQAVVSRAIHGDLGEAINHLADSTTLKVGINAVETDGLKFSESVSAGIFKIGVDATYAIEDRTEIFSHSGTVSALAEDVQDLLVDVVGP